MGGVNTANLIDTVSPADSLKAGSDKYNAHWHDYDAVTLENRTGGTRTVGDVAALSLTTDLATGAADVQGSYYTFVVCRVASLANTASGEWARAGVIPGVKASGAISRGAYVRKSATAWSVETTGIVAGPTTFPPPGACGIALTSASSGVVTCYWFGFTWPSLAAAGADIVNVASMVEEFASASTNTAPTTATLVQSTHNWWVRSNVALMSANIDSGAWSVVSTGSVGGHLQQARGDSTLADVWVPARNPTIHMAFAQGGSGAGTRRIGLGSGWTSGADPADGIYIRFADAGNMIAVTRSGGADIATLDTLVAAAANVFHSVRLVKSGTSVIVDVDGVTKGSISSVGLTASLGFGCNVSVTTAGLGVIVDLLAGEQSR